MTNILRRIVLLVVATGLAGDLNAQTLTDIGSAAPSPGTNDIYQLSTQGNQPAVLCQMPLAASMCC